MNENDRTGSLMINDCGLEDFPDARGEAVLLPDRGYFGGHYPVPGTGVEDDKIPVGPSRQADYVTWGHKRLRPERPGQTELLDFSVFTDK